MVTRDSGWPISSFERPGPYRGRANLITPELRDFGFYEVSRDAR